MAKKNVDLHGILVDIVFRFHTSAFPGKEDVFGRQSLMLIEPVRNIVRTIQAKHSSEMDFHILANGPAIKQADAFVVSVEAICVRAVKVWQPPAGRSWLFHASNSRVFV